MIPSKLKSIILAVIITIVAVSLISFPQESVEASRRGLEMWWEIVFPSLLPFFIICEVLISFGVVGFLGVILEPFMKPLFRVPGVGGFVWAMGMASGFPTGAKLTARLRLEEKLTKIEAERLVSFTNSSNPLFIFGAVSVVFFENPELGAILALSHYLGNISIGLIMRFYGNDKGTSKNKGSSFSIKHALSVLHQTRLKDKRPFGTLLGDAVLSSINTLLMVGGFIILFSVINKLLIHLHITDFLASIINYVLNIFDLEEMLTVPLMAGLMEITTGSQMTSALQNANLMHQAIIVSFILAFSGFSVQAQVASILAPTDISFKPFFFARILHGFLSSFFTYILWTPVYHASATNSIPVFLFGKEEQQAFFNLMNIGPIITIVALTVYILIFARRIFKGVTPPLR
ncbi:sporulation integral membrane protein YlbJ [Peribacillus glennii]|uniref:Sporulation integral membrane protein YlbJ n=1 Tax=Peribacillus glennii TaxID=2303991 RepID=A0A372LEZ1_9BACI|nr:sporulation integral membrane protein YlbJ [Peribacillus glennii]RFU64807.1 sporulation integral membrane protein YlbJ [Peribacillus glennii]